MFESLKEGDWVKIVRSDLTGSNYSQHSPIKFAKVTKVTQKQFVADGVRFQRRTGRYGNSHAAYIAPVSEVNAYFKGRHQFNLTRLVIKKLQDTLSSTEYLEVETLTSILNLIDESDIA